VVFFQHEEAKEVKDAVKRNMISKFLYLKELISDEINEFRLRKITTIRRGGQRGKMNITVNNFPRIYSNQKKKRKTI